jgi:hypothetical protein
MGRKRTPPKPAVSDQESSHPQGPISVKLLRVLHALGLTNLPDAKYEVYVLVFGENSRPVISFATGDVDGRAFKVGDEYHDNSSGPTGAKAVGKEAHATNTGPVIQQASAASARWNDLSSGFEALLHLLSDVNPADEGPLESTRTELTRGLSEANKPSPDPQVISTAWGKAKEWISAALLLGLFATEKAEQIRTIVERIGKIIGS